MMTYVIDVQKLNRDGLNYLNELFKEPQLNADSLDDIYAYMQKLEDSRIIILNNEDLNDESSAIIRIIAEANADNGNFTLEYSIEENTKHTVILDIATLNEQGHPYLKEIFNFPDYYGNNLDALYDCLSELDDTEIIIINMDNVNEFSLNVLSVIDDVIDDYQNITIYDAEEKHDEDED